MTRRRTILFAAAAAALMWPASTLLAAGGHSDKGCAMCHVPHGASTDNAVQLWNPAQTTTLLSDAATYSSDTLDAADGAVNGSSVLCLSCHDGSHSSTGHKFGGALGEGDTLGGMGNLAQSHPIGITYDVTLWTADGELRHPDDLEAGVLDGGDRIQCQSCHDPHIQADQTDPLDPGAKYLRWAYWDGSGKGAVRNSPTFCRNCHDK